MFKRIFAIGLLEVKFYVETMKFKKCPRMCCGVVVLDLCDGLEYEQERKNWKWSEL